MSGLSAAAFAASVRRARTGAGMTLGQVAISAGVTVQAISLIERGKTTPRLDTAIALCRPLGLSLEEACTPDGGQS